MYVTVPHDPYKDFDPVTVAVSAATCQIDVCYDPVRSLDAEQRPPRYF
jgi:hypothetical protein